MPRIALSIVELILKELNVCRQGHALSFVEIRLVGRTDMGGAARGLYRSGGECGTALFEEAADGVVAFESYGDLVRVASLVERAGAAE